VAEVEATVEDTMAVGEEAMEVATTEDEVATMADGAATTVDHETTLLPAKPTHLEATTQRTGTTDERPLLPGATSTTLAGPTRGGLGTPYLSERGMSRRLVSEAALPPLAVETTGSEATSRCLCPLALQRKMQSIPKLPSVSMEGPPSSLPRLC
jgi:hypothetical protein